MSRESFLATVRQAAAAGRAHRVGLVPVPEQAGYLGLRPGEDAAARLAAEVDAVGGTAFRVADLAAARELLANWLDEFEVRSALTWEHDLLVRLGLAALLAEHGIVEHSHRTLVEMPEEGRRLSILACDIGITSCDWAIAETGTLMVCSRPGQERVASLLPPVYFSIVEREQIVPDLIDAIGSVRTADGTLPSNITLITGPSKTGDIELELTTGVHGPGKWRVIVVG
jgi:L-lactate dehydrogenase complex protein LldG